MANPQLTGLPSCSRPSCQRPLLVEQTWMLRQIGDIFVRVVRYVCSQHHATTVIER